MFIFKGVYFEILTFIELIFGKSFINYNCWYLRRMEIDALIQITSSLRDTT